MKKYNILVTGVGAIIGYGLINSLRQCKYDVNIIGMDIYDDAYGQYICDKFIKAKLAADEDYPEWLKSVIKENDIDLVLFGVEQEAIRLAKDIDRLGEEKHKVVINRPNIIELSQDKWLTYKLLEENNIEAIPTRIEGSFDELKNEFGCPFLLKPRRSYASKGIEKIHTEAELEYHREKTADQFMVQKIIGDAEHEYTAGAFGYGDGKCNKPIVMRRKLSGEGATAKAEVIDCPEIEEEIRRYSEILKPIGPTNFQFRKDGDKYLLLEINPRISSSTSLRTAFGYNEAEMCIDYFVNGILPQTGEIKKGTAIRYIADYIVG